MIIKSIELQNFRNYEDLNISFDEGTNIFYGDNAQGKTNILEAAYLSGTTKSHKCSKDKEMIRFGEQESHIRTVVVKKDKEYQIDMHLNTIVPRESQSIKFRSKKPASFLEFSIWYFSRRRI